MFDLSDHELLREGITTKERLLKTMGFPTIVSDMDEEVWIYYSEEIKKILFFNPEITSRTVLVIAFDDDNIIKELKKIDLSKEEKNINFVSDYTAVSGHKQGFFKSIFSNVGKVSAQ